MEVTRYVKKDKKNCLEKKTLHRPKAMKDWLV